jgi:hypothetical protein
MSYGVDLVEAFQLAASYVDRILRGAKPSPYGPKRTFRDRRLMSAFAGKADIAN